MSNSGKLATRRAAVESDVARELAGRFDAERRPSVAHELFAPDALVGTADPVGSLVKEPPDGYCVGPPVAPERRKHSDEGLLQEPLEIVGLHARHAPVVADEATRVKTSPRNLARIPGARA